MKQSSFENFLPSNTNWFHLKYHNLYAFGASTGKVSFNPVSNIAYTVALILETSDDFSQGTCTSELSLSKILLFTTTSKLRAYISSEFSPKISPISPVVQSQSLELIQFL
jgi:hypothetical protein